MIKDYGCGGEMQMRNWRSEVTQISPIHTRKIDANNDGMSLKNEPNHGLTPLPLRIAEA
jgi:hypothetical protein